MGIDRSPLSQNQVKLPLPRFGGHLCNFAWFYSTKLPLKTVKSSPFFLIMVNYHIFSLNYHILYFHMCFQYISFLKKIRTIYQKRVTFRNFWNRSSHRNDCFWFLELFSTIYQAHSVGSSFRNVFFSYVLISE